MEAMISTIIIFTLNIASGISDDLLFPPISFQHQPSNIITSNNATTIFECQLHGETSSQITWFKDGAIVKPSTFRNILANNSLVIKNPTESMEGIYQCSLTILGVGAIVSRKAKLTVNALSVEEVNLVANNGDSLILPCSIKSNADIFWTKNDATTKLNGDDVRFVFHNNGDLEIMNVSDSDYGKYGCYTNGYKLSSSVMLIKETNKLIEEPIFTKKPQNVSITENGVATFMCSVRAVGDLKIIWMKNGAPITLNERVKVVGRCSLYIWKVNDQDEGKYQIRASVLKSHIFDEVLLKVMTPPRFIVRPPATTFARVNDDLLLNCKSLGNPAPIVSWYKNGDLLYNSAYINISNNGTLRIVGIMPSDGGLYQCMAENELMSDHTITRVVIRETTDDHSNNQGFLTPSSSLNSSHLLDISTYLIQSTAIGIKWTLNNLLLNIPHKLGFRVQWESVTSNGCLNTSAFEIIVNELKPSSSYKFTVSLLHQYDNIFINSDSINVTTLSNSLLHATPQNINVEVLETKSVTISWELSPNFDEILVTGFELIYHKHGKVDTKEQITIERTHRSLDLSGLQNGTIYVFKILTLCSNKASPPSEWIRFTTMKNDLDESKPPGKPMSLKSHSTSSTISLSWLPPSDNKIKIRGYELSYGIGRPDAFSQVLESKQRFHVVKNLRPSSEYVISLKAYNRFGRGIPTYNSIFTKVDIVSFENPIPMTPPVGLQIKIISSTVIALSWSDASFVRLQKAKGTSDGRTYIIRYNPNNLKPHKQLNVTALEANITDLRPDTEYEFSVKVTKGFRESLWSLSALGRTKEAVPSSPPRELSVTADDNSGIILSWQPPRQANGKIIGYVVHYSRDATITDDQWFSEEVNGEGTSVNIEGLSKATNYFFKVRARNAEGLGPLSPTIIFSTGKEHSETLENSESTSRDNISFMWNLLGVVVGGVLLICSAFSVCVVCKLKNKSKHSVSSIYSRETNSLDNLSNGKSLKPPDLWTHGSGLNDSRDLKSCIPMDQNSDGNSTIDKWTIQSSNNQAPVDEIRFQTTLKMNQKLTETSSLIGTTSTFNQKSTCPRVYVGDVAQSTLGSASTTPSLFSQYPRDYDLPPILPPLSSPRILIPSKHFIGGSDVFRQAENSSEDLSQEMANIEGLMKDLNAISKQQRLNV